VTKRPGGRKTKYDWPAFVEEAIRILEEEGTFDPKVDPTWRQSNLENLMTGWCSRTWGEDGTPVESMIRGWVKKADAEFKCRSGR
jgi:hypothetical protein